MMTEWGRRCGAGRVDQVGRALLAPLALLALVAGCEEPLAPTGPPRCEPQEELAVERRLKDGFRALAVGDREAAVADFELLLGDEPGHPEALVGLRLATRGDAVVRPRAPSPGAAPRGSIIVAGEAVPVDLPVNTERYRFEERRALREVARARGLEPVETPLPRWYLPRTDAAGAEVDPRDRAAVLDVIDLVVLHDSLTVTARESFVAFGAQPGSTHFLIDWDGTVFQTLDLAWEANHVAMTPIDRRSVSVDLVNPVDITTHEPVPAEAAQTGVTRPLSELVRIQGEEAQAWGYTEPQLKSLIGLVRALSTLFPRLPAVVPRDFEGGGALVPRGALAPGAAPVGIVGHLHLFPRAVDPGPGFPWESFGAALR